MSEPSDEQIKDITDALLKGQKIEAIKIYREAMGSSLKDSKDFIDDLNSTLRQKHPEKFPATKAGCTPVLTMMLALGGLVALTLEWLGNL